jgi:hypothetical protein
MIRPLVAALAAAALSTLPVTAQDATAAPSLALELNALQPSEGGCRITFLATNGLAGAIEKATFEVALFGTGGGIDRLVSLDFKALAKGKTKVLQFELAGLQCDAVSRVLVNDVTACEGEELTPDDCLANLETSTRTKAAFGV